MSYDAKTHRVGRISMALMMALLLLSPCLVCLVFQEPFHFTPGYWTALGAILVQFVPSGVLEVITYSPMLGTGGTYIAFITGNLVNLKIPCAMNARAIAGTKVGTEENEIISTIAVSTSAIVTTLVIAVGVLAITPLTPLLENPVLTPAFKTVVYALFGAMGWTYLTKYPVIAIVPWALGAVLFFLIPALTGSVSIMVVVLAVIAMVYGQVLYRRKKV
ncbi:MAG: hypothetical protein LKH04_08210 [Lachnospiraceae bacterium]|jgi:hypothetical protein|nr:hypothetical protein [Lachnospiraceae bacterium]MCI1398119.1 hypothetical protein [Lachnospiraceae bacterium]MCI1424260.1 hypothetical protein [Lachnospiraceae bacterium]MCI1452332.1 hypothetical protein [Lachnospiraceae bacterium]